MLAPTPTLRLAGRLGAALALVAASAQPAFAGDTATVTPQPAIGQAGAVSASVDADVVEARAAFQEGLTLASEDRWADALQAFERSRALHPHAITTYNAGYCQLRLGHMALARELLLAALAEDRARGGGELTKDLVNATQAHLAEAESQLASQVTTGPTRPSEGAVASPGGPHYAPGFVLIGIGAASLAVGAISGLVAFGYKGSVHDDCASPTSADACNQQREAGHRAADISTAGFVAGGAVVAVGAVLLLVASGRIRTTAHGTVPSLAAHGPEIRPFIGWGTLGLGGRF